MSKHTKETKRRQAEIKKAETELDGIRTELGEAYRLFNATADPALLDACIYEINALHSRYDHALKGIKSLFL